MLNTKESLGRRIEHFFFDEEVPFAMAMVRITLPLALLSMILARWSSVRELFSSDGATAPLGVGYGYWNLLPEFSGTIAVGLYAILIMTLFTSCIGWCTRTSLIISNVLFTYFCMLDYVSTMTKYTVIATHVLFILALSECGSMWSVDAWLAGRKRSYWPGEPSLVRSRFPVWPRRLLQLHIGAVYFGASITKMHTPSFFTGDQLQYWMQTHINIQHPLGEYLSLYPILLIAMAYVAVVWEVTFIFIGWKSMWRCFMLPIGVLFHFMTMVTLGLMLFPVICFITYLSFLDEEDVQQYSAWWRQRVRQSAWIGNINRQIKAWRERMGDPVGWKASSRAAFVFATALFCVACVELEHWQDPYGIRRPEGPYPLPLADTAIVEKILSPTERLRDSDMFFAVDTGTILVGDQLANRRREFRQGETLIAHCHLTPPHEDMWIECQIQDSNHRIIDRLGAVATREMFRSNFTYAIGDHMAPGEYTLVIATAGRPVMKKMINVLPKHGTASAN